jgi:hypothetical protein
MQQASMGINPMTGMAFQDEGEVQQFIMQAAFSPLPFENSPMHLDTHALYMKGVEYEGLPPDAKQRFLMHYTSTSQKIQSEQPAQEGVKTSLQLKGTIGPTGAAAVLSKQGNPEITPEVMAEPPLETWVTDSMDKPDTDEAGNDPLTQAEVVRNAVAEEEKHTAEQNRLEQEHQQKMIHNEEMHRVKMEQARKPKAPSRG